MVKWCKVYASIGFVRWRARACHGVVAYPVPVNTLCLRLPISSEHRVRMLSSVGLSALGQLDALSDAFFALMTEPFMFFEAEVKAP